MRAVGGTGRPERRHFGLTISGEPLFGWRLRSIGAPADGNDGRVWLRGASEQPEWAHGNVWTGNADANTVLGLPKPRLLDRYEWTEGSWRSQRAEVLTLLPGAPCSSTPDARADIAVSPTWWTDLQTALTQLASTSTDRISISSEKFNRGIRDAFGDAAAGIHVERWETVHADLHWANLLHSPLGILDWEMWGRGPAGTDAATLYCYSLAVPDLARKIRRHFPVLDTPDGHRAQLYVAARLLRRAKMGDHPHLSVPLQHHTRQIMAKLTNNQP
ncbi:aminoglycoside phosphotransferase [Streptomyces xiamenensis]|uniref:aminoglycoside phosphotransferase n=1 Tax=Streptomyces xiamenensis TaxID=408015 RepID=UPI0036E3E311